MTMPSGQHAPPVTPARALAFPFAQTPAGSGSAGSMHAQWSAAAGGMAGLQMLSPPPPYVFQMPATHIMSPVPMPPLPFNSASPQHRQYGGSQGLTPGPSGRSGERGVDLNSYTAQCAAKLENNADWR
jgi:hypothetical protein